MILDKWELDLEAKEEWQTVPDVIAHYIRAKYVKIEVFCPTPESCQNLKSASYFLYSFNKYLPSTHHVLESMLGAGPQWGTKWR